MNIYLNTYFRLVHILFDLNCSNTKISISLRLRASKVIWRDCVPSCTHSNSPGTMTISSYRQPRVGSAASGWIDPSLQWGCPAWRTPASPSATKEHFWACAVRHHTAPHHTRDSIDPLAQALDGTGCGWGANGSACTTTQKISVKGRLGSISMDKLTSSSARRYSLE